MRAETTALRRDLSAARGHLSTTEKSMLSLQRGAENLVKGFLGFEAARRAVGHYLTVVQEAEQSQAKLDAVLKATGHSAGVTAGQVNVLADEMARTSLFDDDAIRDASAVMLTFRQVQGDTFKEGMRLAADMSAVMGQDLQASVVQLGKALNSPVDGLTALRRVGVQFNDTQKEMIQNLVNTNDVAGAQQIILEELRKEFGGAAEGANAGLTGAVGQAKKAYDDFLESLGKTGQVSWVGNFLKGLSANLRAMELTTSPIEDAFIALDEMNKKIRDADAVITQDPTSRLGKYWAAKRPQLIEERDYQESLITILQRRQHAEEEAAAAAARSAAQAEANARATERYREETERLEKAVPKVTAHLETNAEMMANVARAAHLMNNIKTEGLWEQMEPREKMKELAEEGAKAADAWEVAWIRAVENIQDTLADFLTFTEGRVASLQDLLLSVLKTIQRIAAQMAAARIIGAITGVISGAGGGIKGGGSGDVTGKFTPSTSASTVMSQPSPSMAPAGGREVHVHLSPRIQIAALDAPSVQALFVQQGATLNRMLKKGIKEDPELAAILHGRG